jgi:histidinol phosphatase-like enzyme
VREPDAAEGRALILDFDDLLGRAAAALRPEDVTIEQTRLDALAKHRNAGWLFLVHAWRPQVARNETTLLAVEACFARLRELLGGAADTASCPHDAGPPVCWCRKPIPGSVIEFASRRGVALARSIVVGTSAADRTMAERLGARFELSTSFFA